MYGGLAINKHLPTPTSAATRCVAAPFDQCRLRVGRRAAPGLVATLVTAALAKDHASQSVKCAPPPSPCPPSLQVPKRSSSNADAAADSSSNTGATTAATVVAGGPLVLTAKVIAAAVGLTSTGWAGYGNLFIILVGHFFPRPSKLFWGGSSTHPPAARHPPCMYRTQSAHAFRMRFGACHPMACAYRYPRRSGTVCSGTTPRMRRTRSIRSRARSTRSALDRTASRRTTSSS